MEAIKAYFGSMGTRSVRAALYGYLFNLFFSLIGYFGFYMLLSGAAGESLPAREAAGQIGLFSLLSDIIYNYEGGLPLLFSLLALLVILYLAASIFSAGGIYGIFIDEQKATFTNLVYTSAENFLPMLKMFLINLLNWAAASIVPVGAMVLYWKPGILEINEGVWSIFFFVWAAVTVLILIFSTAVYDFSRIYRLEEERNFLYSFKEGVKFTFSNKINVLLLFVFYGISLLILYVVYLLVSGILDSLAYTVIIFLVYQILMFVRHYLKVALMQAEVKIAAPVE